MEVGQFSFQTNIGFDSSCCYMIDFDPIDLFYRYSRPIHFRIAFLTKCQGDALFYYTIAYLSDFESWSDHVGTWADISFLSDFVLLEFNPNGFGLKSRFPI